VTDVRVTHVGGPTALLEIGGWRILTDPTFDPPGRRYDFGLGTSSRKVAGPAVAAAGLGPVDAVLLTHDHHADNLDDAGRTLLGDVPVVVTTASGAGRLGRGRGDRGLRAWETTNLEAPGRPTILVTATPCRHGPPLSHPVVGDVVGFSLRWDGQAHGELWVTGDTVLHRRLREVGRRLRVGTVLAHLGGVRFGLTGPLRYTMTGRDLVTLYDWVHPHQVLPVHYEGWSHFHDDRADVEAALAAAPDVADRVRWLEPGVPGSVVV
jgi:L-ascorbate metabolism protein UlaG (beta-lactamase superfamily)